MRKVLIVQLRQLGDILLTTPVLREIKRHSPKTHLTFLSHRMGQPILDGNPFVDEYFMYDESSVIEQIRLAEKLRARGFDQVIDFMNNPRSAIFTFATRAIDRVAFSSNRRIAYTDIVERPNGSEYIVRQKFLLLRAAGFEAHDESLTLPWVEAHTGPLVKCFGENHAFRDAEFRVLLSPTHRREVRRWPLERFAELADYLVEKYAAHVYWLWGPGEEQEIDRAISLCRKPTLKTPATSFKEMAAFIANHDLFIGNSNGPSHVAVATSICSLQLHGPTLATAWCPLNETHHAIQSSDPSHAMEGIKLSDVIREVEKMRPAIEARVDKRKHKGPRLTWRQ